MITFIKLCDNQANENGAIVSAQEIKEIKEIFPKEQSDKHGHIIKELYVITDKWEIEQTKERYTALVAEVYSSKARIEGKAELAVSFGKKEKRRDGLTHLSSPNKVVKWEII